MANDPLVEAITAAVGSHWMWKARLKAAIASKHLETPISTIYQEDQCAFGKWLIAMGLTKDNRDPQYGKVRELHALFHKAAGEVAVLVANGHGQEAIELMDTGAYAKISQALTEALLEWKGMAVKAPRIPSPFKHLRGTV